MTMGTNDRADAALAMTGDVLVEAGPGTGKTHLLTRKIAALVDAGVVPGRILVLTFSRFAATQLRRRVTAACEIRTFHGFASVALEAGGTRFASRRLLDDFTGRLVATHALRGRSFATLSPAAVGSRRFLDDAMRFATDLRRARRPAVDRLRATATPRLRDLLGAADAMASARETLAASDLDDLITRLVDALDDPASAQTRWLAPRYDHLLVDEFQDVDDAQIALCEAIVAATRATVFAVGDPAQSIYRFRGAGRDAFHEGARRLRLTEAALDRSWRCPQTICDLAARTPLLDALPLTSCVDDPTAGAIEVLRARTTSDEAALIADHVERALVDDVLAKDIAVLVRSMRPVGTAVVEELTARRIAVATTDASAFFADPAVTYCRLALRAVARPTDPARWHAFLGSLGVERLPSEAAVALATARLDSLDVALSWIAEHVVTLPGDEALTETLAAAASSCDVNELGRAARRITRDAPMLRELVGSHDAFAARTSLTRIRRFVDLLTEAQRALARIGAPASSAEIVDRVDEDAATIGAGETPGADAPGVRVMTIHAAKGLQFRRVVIGDAVEGQFPTSPRVTSLYAEDERVTLERAGVDVVDARHEGAEIEEAALWYVAVTRTADRLTITYAEHGADDATQRPSRFVPIAWLPGENDRTYERDLVRPEVALLAAAATDDDADGRVARAMLDALATSSPFAAALRQSGLALFDATLEPEIVASPAHTASAVETWLQCPRRWYYRHALGLRDDATLRSDQGSAIHEVLERFHREVVHVDATCTGDVDGWIARLRELREIVWATFDWGTEPLRAATAEAADRRLAAYARSLADDGATRPFRVVATEAAIVSHFPRGDVRGKIDRVDRVHHDGSLILRDYKSSRLKPSSAQKTRLPALFKDGGPNAGSIHVSCKTQLGLYRRGAEESFDARVHVLDYVYLAGSDASADTVHDVVETTDARIATPLAGLESFVDEKFLAAFTRGADVPLATDEETCKYCEFGRRKLCEGASA